MANQNRIENVAKYIGHKTINLTYGTYWDIGFIFMLPQVKHEYACTSRTDQQHEYSLVKQPRMKNKKKNRKQKSYWTDYD